MLKQNSWGQTRCIIGDVKMANGNNGHPIRFLYCIYYQFFIFSLFIIYVNLVYTHSVILVIQAIWLVSYLGL